MEDANVSMIEPPNDIGKPNSFSEDENRGSQAEESTETTEFAYPQLPSRLTQQEAKLLPAVDDSNGTNFLEESFNASVAGQDNAVPADALRTPFLESTRIASTPRNANDGPTFDEDIEISQVQLNAADRSDESESLTRLGSDEQVNGSTQTSLDASLNKSSVQPFESPVVNEEKEPHADQKLNENSANKTDDSKSLLDKAFLSETVQNNKGNSSNQSGTVDDYSNNQSIESDSARMAKLSENGTASELSELVSETAAVEEAPPVQELAKPPSLPDTVTELTAFNGVKVYLVGTAHFSLESQKDVAVTIAIAQPNVVMVELCRSRLNILHMDEEAILKEAKDINLAKVRETIRQHGAVQGALYLLFLSTSAHLTRQLGMAPGGEFRRAYNEARNVAGCTVHLGDRPIHVTLQRALGALTLWQKLKLVWHLLTSRETISPEEVERCKQRDLLEELLKEMTGEFPALSRVFVQERDLCLAHSLQIAAAAALDQQRMRQDNKTPSVVAVVGIGHVSGMVSYFGKVKESDVREVMAIPPPSRSGKILVGVVKYGLLGLVCYGAYKILPVPRIETIFK